MRQAPRKGASQLNVAEHPKIALGLLTLLLIHVGVVQDNMSHVR